MTNDNSNIQSAGNTRIQLFQGQQVRTLWNEEEQKWYFSIVDVVAILTDQPDAKRASTYWSVLKGRLRKEGADQPLTNCKKLKMLSADGKLHPTDAADQPTLFRIIQSVPSKKAEPFKQWMAQVASDRLDQMQNPELNFEQAYSDYRRLGYSDKWINQRLKSIEIRKALTDEWDRAGVKQGQQYASLTDIITREWSDKTTAQYKRFKGLHKESLRDNMTNMELALTIFAEASTAEISKARNPKGYRQSAEIAHKGGQIAGEARKKLEEQIGHSVISSKRTSDYLPPVARLQLPDDDKDD
ncbi:MAG: Bro-N domain-containing protein [Prevotellaceae bacterium]|nr:Bro-N domain-containing protein [Candidatus Faecinaster equi]